MGVEDNIKLTLRNILAAQEDEADCQECFEHLDKFAEMVEAGGDASALLPRIQEHLDSCHCCHGELKALLAIMEAEASDREG